MNDSVCTHRRAKSGDPSGRQESALVRRNTTALSRCRSSHHLIGGIEQRGIQQLDQHPETEVVALVRSRREQEQIARVRLQRLGELVVLRFPDPVSAAECRQMVRLVKHDQVPWRRILQSLHALGPLQRVDAGDQPVVLGERVGLAVGHVAFAAEHLEVEIEDLIEFAVPVVHQAGRHHHESALQFSARRPVPAGSARFRSSSRGPLHPRSGTGGATPSRCDGSALPDGAADRSSRR